MFDSESVPDTVLNELLASFNGVFNEEFNDEFNEDLTRANKVFNESHSAFNEVL